MTSSPTFFFSFFPSILPFWISPKARSKVPFLENPLKNWVFFTVCDVTQGKGCVQCLFRRDHPIRIVFRLLAEDGFWIFSQNLGRNQKLQTHARTKIPQGPKPPILRPFEFPLVSEILRNPGFFHGSDGLGGYVVSLLFPTLPTRRRTQIIPNLGQKKKRIHINIHLLIASSG